MASQQSFGHDNIQVLVKESQNVHIEISGTKVASLWVPPFRSQPFAGKATDLSILLATTAITDLTGRDELWQSCFDWCNLASLDPVSVRCITGRGGSGKTRFALELVHHLRTLPDWDARFVRFITRQPFDVWAKTSGSSHVLLVFDYAADNATEIAASLRALIENPPLHPNRRLRILLLARTADWNSGWLAQFKPSSTLEAAQPLSGLFEPEQPIELSPLTVEDRIRVFQQAYQTAANRLGLPTHPLDQAAFESPHADTTLKDPLTLMMAAIVGLRSGVPNALSLTRIELAHQTADLLVAQRLSKTFPDNPGLALHLAAYATLTAGLPREHALAVLHVEAQTNHLGVIQNPSGFLDRLSSWLPAKSPDQILGPIEPDIVGEAFLLGNPIPRLINPEQTILRAIEKRADQTIQFLIRTTQDFCLAEEGVRSEPLEWLEALIAKGDTDDFGLLFQIEEALPDSSVVLRAHALSIKQKLVERLRHHIRQQLDEHGGLSVDLLSVYALHLSKLAIAQKDVGEREQALDSAEEALILHRELVRRDPDTFLPDLSRLLRNLAIMQSAMGQHEQALVTGNECVTIARELVQHDSDTFLPHLAMSLNNLCTLQNEVGQLEQALATGKEAVTLKRHLVERDRDTFLPSFAMSLNNLANLQDEAGEHHGALATAHEAEAIYRELAERNRDAFLTDLAMSLTNLANVKSHTGNHDGALATANEAVRLRRELVQRNREAFLPDLASTLNNFSIMQSDVGDHQQALITAQEATSINYELVENNRAFLPDYAISLTNLSSRLSEVGEHEEALNTARNAVMIYRELAEHNRNAYLPDLAISLNNLANRLSQMGVHEQALATAVETVMLRRELVERNRDAFLPGLAKALHNLANRQREVGDRRHAIGTAQEAVDLYRELLRNRNLYLSDLAHAHGTLGMLQADNELFAEARQSFAESLRLLVPYIEDHPFAPHIELALILCRNYLAACERGSLAPDMQLLDNIAPVLGPYLDPNEPGESS